MLFLCEMIEAEEEDEAEVGKGMLSGSDVIMHTVSWAMDVAVRCIANGSSND